MGDGRRGPRVAKMPSSRRPLQQQRHLLEGGQLGLPVEPGQPGEQPGVREVGEAIEARPSQRASSSIVPSSCGLRAACTGVSSRDWCDVRTTPMTRGSGPVTG